MSRRYRKSGIAGHVIAIFGAVAGVALLSAWVAEMVEMSILAGPAMLIWVGLAYWWRSDAYHEGYVNGRLSKMGLDR